MSKKKLVTVDVSKTIAPSIVKITSLEGLKKLIDRMLQDFIEDPPSSNYLLGVRDCLAELHLLIEGVDFTEDNAK